MDVDVRWGTLFLSIADFTLPPLSRIVHVSRGMPKTAAKGEKVGLGAFLVGVARIEGYFW